MSTTEKEISTLKRQALSLFRKAYQVHNQLGEDGKLPQSINAFGEKTLSADWEAEEVFIKGCGQFGIPIVISSEEHGEVFLVDNPKYRGVLDGIDGTNAFKMGTGPYGTMFTIFEGANPSYRDYLVSGILQYPSGEILLASRGEGTFIYEGSSIHPATTSNKTTADSNSTKIFIDGGIFNLGKKLFHGPLRDFKYAYLGNIDNLGVPWGASAIYYFKLATGEADVVLECTRKRNLEYAVAFGILNEAGAVITDIDGESIGDKKYLQFGQNEYLPLIAAATQPLALQVAEFIKS